MYTTHQAKQRTQDLAAMAQLIELLQKLMGDIVGDDLRVVDSTDTSYLLFQSKSEKFESIRVRVSTRATTGARSGWGTWSNLSVNIQTPYAHSTVPGRTLLVTKLDTIATTKLHKSLLNQFLHSVEASTERKLEDQWRRKAIAAKAAREASVDAMLLHIASKHLHLDTLETRNNDSLDFVMQSAAGIKAALEAAYAAGKAAK